MWSVFPGNQLFPCNRVPNLLPPPGGYVIIWVCMCMCVCVCMCVCMCVCLSVSTITKEIPNIFIRNFLNAFRIGQGRID
jgi:hypothetical protein